MSHLHIPDGVLPLWLVLLGWAATFLLLALSSRRLAGPEGGRRLPLLGVVAALMIVGMTLEIAPIGYHINLTVLGGMLLGPAAGFVAAFVVDLILGLLGHGGITVVGLNTLVIGAEVVLGYYVFWLFRRALARLGLGVVTASATAVTLFLSTLLMIGVVGLSRIDPGYQAPEATVVEAGGLAFQNPFGKGVLKLELFGASDEEEPAAAEAMDLGTFATIVLVLGLVGWIVEAPITALITTTARRLKPDILHPALDPARGVTER